jgi:hypothetical protein
LKLAQGNASFPRKSFLGFVVVTFVLVAWGCGSTSSPASSNPQPTPTLSSIAVTPPLPSISLTSTEQFSAMGTYSDGSKKDLTSSATWSSTPTAAVTVATISTTGLASGVHSGTTMIAAALGTINGSTTLTVDAGSVAIGSMSTARENHTATLLNNGMVLVTGGGSGAAGVLASAELYDPTAGTFALTGSMSTARESHTATLLANGMVLIAGGDNGSGPVASAELYNPATGTFSPVGSMSAARENHTATLLYNGMVLIAGGASSGGSLLATAELYNPATGIFTLTASMSTARENHTAVSLFNALVLIAGGDNGNGALSSAELYDPNAGTFTLTGSLTAGRESHTATLLNGGTVLIAGGSTSSSGSALAGAEIYDPVAGTFALTGNMTAARYFQTATLLNNGTVLVAGGKNSTGILASTELYDPGTGSFATSANMNAPRDPFTATLLNTGSVLITGGQTSGGGALQIAEIYEPITLNIPGLVSIAVSPKDSGILPDTTELFSAVGSFSGGSSENLASVTWSSSATNIATIGKTGMAVGIAPGFTNITASAGSVSSAGAVVTVGTPDCVVLSPAVSSIAPGTTEQINAFAIYNGGLACQVINGRIPIVSFVDVTPNVTTWSSTTPGVATISPTGLATAFKRGTTTIEASYGGAQIVSALPTNESVPIGTYPTLTVDSVASMAVTPANVTSTLLNPAVFLQGELSGNGMQQFEATAILVGGATENMTAYANWSSSAPTVATISPSALLTAVGPGTTTILATLAGGLTASTTFTIPSLVSIAVTPENSVKLVGNTQQYTATGVFADGETQNYTSIAKWTSSATGVATIGPTGLANIAGLGPTTIQAVVAPLIGSTTVPAISNSTTLTGTNSGFVLTGSLNTARYAHTATQLSNGMILIAGGVNGEVGNLSQLAVASAELYNPSTGKFTPTGSMTVPRAGHTATLLNNGMVLITGGEPTLLSATQIPFPSTFSASL